MRVRPHPPPHGTRAESVQHKNAIYLLLCVCVKMPEPDCCDGHFYIAYLYYIESDGWGVVRKSAHQVIVIVFARFHCARRTFLHLTMCDRDFFFVCVCVLCAAKHKTRKSLFPLNQIFIHNSDMFAPFIKEKIYILYLGLCVSVQVYIERKISIVEQ